MTFQPAHKVVGDAHKPGQTINITKEYIDKVMREERKKTSFDEWYNTIGYQLQFDNLLFINSMRQCWNASRENM